MTDVMHRYVLYFSLDAAIFGIFAFIALRRVLLRGGRGRLSILFKTAAWSLQFASFAWVRTEMAVTGPRLFRVDGAGTEIIRLVAMLALAWMTYEYSWGSAAIVHRGDRPGKIVARRRWTDFHPDRRREKGE